MATIKDFKTHWNQVSEFRAAITAAFYAQSVRAVTVAEAYHLACKQPEVIVSDEPMYQPERYGLTAEAKVLVINDGGVTGRSAKARRIVENLNPEEKRGYHTMLTEAMYQLTKRPCIRTTGVLGLDPHYMVRAHFLTPENNAMDMFNWLVNFTPFPEIAEQYAKSRPIEGFDIVIAADPEWKSENPKFHDGPLVLFDPANQAVAVLGLRYFGEKKKATLTLGWDLGVRLGMVACHAGVKKVVLKEGDGHVERAISFFGLSGSGKSSLTNNYSHNGAVKAEDGEHVTIIHDDAFVVDLENDMVVAMEPTLFDKTDATKPFSQDIEYWVSAQNQLVAEADGRLRIFPADVRNPNGRAIKSRDWIGVIENSCKAPDFVCWLMKDELLPPIIYLDDPDMAVAMGACLSTKRSLAENVSIEETKKLVIEPFANPFRVYSLATDCAQFRKMFGQFGVKGYILNTGFFLNTKVEKEMSLDLVVRILRQNLTFQDWLPGMKVTTPGTLDAVFAPPTDAEYREKLRVACEQRVAFLTNEKAPDWCIAAIQRLVDATKG